MAWAYRIFSLLVFVSITFGSCSTSQCAQTTFEIKADGAVVSDSRQYQSLSDYFRSDEFRVNGKRCGTKPRAAALAGASEFAPAATQDCTFSRTVIKDEYYPGRAHVIPIVFHVIRKTDGTGNIPDTRIYSQVRALNEDYRARAGTLGAAGFDSHIQFELAGITRTTNDTWFADEGETAYKTALGWDQNRYLNIYVNSASGYLGYAYFPQSSAGTVRDGVVVLYDSCGGRDQGTEPYDQGRTLTHEIGHYLGLYHTFEGGCGIGYREGDLIEDTNPETEEHYSCVQTNTCQTPDPINNYMNYTDDLCMQEFTPEQSNRAVCGLINYRPSLYHLSRGANEKKIFVQKITMNLRSSAEGKSFARGAVIIKDENGRAVPNAIVSIRWGGIVDGTDFKTTNSRGRAIFDSPELAQGGTFNLDVTNVYRADKLYKSSLNVLTSGSVTK
jgi:hypothetical protein